MFFFTYRSFAYILWISVQYFYGIPECVKEWVSMFVSCNAFSWTPFLLYICIVLFNILNFVLCYYI